MLVRAVTAAALLSAAVATW
jgi:hypothetical protein